MIGGRMRRSFDRSSPASKRINRTILYVAGLFACGCLVLALFVLQALEIQSLRRDLRDLQTAQQQAGIAQAKLRERLAEKDDPEAIEAEARERLGWVMRGEERVIFVDEEE